MRSSLLVAAATVLVLAGAAGAAAQAPPEHPVPPAVLDVMAQPRYAGATWGLRVVDVKSGALVSSLGPDSLFFTGSVRKLFSVAAPLPSLSPPHSIRLDPAPASRRRSTGAGPSEATACCTATSSSWPAATSPSAGARPA